MRVKMIVAYDGTNYCGWQIQPNGITIEQVLNEHLSRLLKEDIKVTGASRTDAGVHSLGNVCMFDTNTRMPAEKISYALNQKLPEDIVVVDSCEVSDDFHPRFSKSRKTYEYRILNARFRNPTRRLDTYFYHYPLDTEKMSEAAKYLIGEHDFASFCSANSQAQTTVRTIYDCTVSKAGDIITIRVTGNGFFVQYGAHNRRNTCEDRWKRYAGRCDKGHNSHNRQGSSRSYSPGTWAYNDRTQVRVTALDF